ncbi:hypothetical protein RB195_007008 [Necator americanus]
MLVSSMLTNLLIVSVSLAETYWYQEFTYPDECPGAKRSGDSFGAVSPLYIIVKKGSRERASILQTPPCQDFGQFSYNTHVSFKVDLFMDKGNQSEYELIYGMRVERKDPACANENPLKYHLKICYSGVTERGTGLDFSTIYYEDPFRIGKVVIKRGGKEGVVVFEYNPPKNCHAPGSWIANEGIYLHDPDTNEFYLIYYDVLKTYIVT